MPDPNLRRSAPAPIPGWTPPDPATWSRRANDRVLLGYAEQLRWRYSSIRFVGLPHLRDEPDVPIEKLFIRPELSRTPISLDAPETDWPTTYWADGALPRLGRAVLLGDPGSGKSTLVQYVCWLLSTPFPPEQLARKYGDLVPLPLILRELPLRADLTWDSLLDLFLTQTIGAALGSREKLETLLATGQGWPLVDGLDEVADPTVGSALREALFDGMRRYPHARWLFTSRIVGYEALPYHRLPLPADEAAEPDRWDLESATPPAEGRFTPTQERHAPTEAEPPIAAVWYLAPFRMRQIQGFAHAWYALHEADPARRKEGADDLAGRIAASGSLLRLARSPVLLTLMALIHRIKAVLPDGRALLYERLAEAYLESIDQERGIRQVGYRLAQQKRWLAWIGYRMQLRRTADARGAGPEFPVLVHRSVVLQWLRESMAWEDPPIQEAAEAEQFLTYLGRRTGLFLPRGTELYAFQHLSLQEYFAACHLLEQITSPEWLLGEAGADATAPTPERLRDWTGDPRWHEVFLLLFELLQDRPRWGDRLAKQLFAPALEDPTAWSHSGAVPDAAVLLAAEISLDEHSGISLDVRRQCWRACWYWCSVFPDWKQPHRVAPRLTSAGLRWQAEVWRVLLKVAPSSLNLAGGTEMTDLQPLAALTNLRHLGLSFCTGVTDLQPLASLTNLEFLDLSVCTGVTDLQPLAGLADLRSLDLRGCTGVTDLRPVARLANLRHLRLAFCTRVTDLQLLAGLTNLELLDLSGCTGLTDLESLAALTNLQSLRMSGCIAVTDLHPLAGLANLGSLDLSVCGRLTELQPLAGLANLQKLDLAFCTGVTDLRPLASLTKLELLDLLGCTEITALQPLAGLANLRSLRVSGCTRVTDLKPLARLVGLRELRVDRSPEMAEMVRALPEPLQRVVTYS